MMSQVEAQSRKTRIAAAVKAFIADHFHRHPRDVHLGGFSVLPGWHSVAYELADDGSVGVVWLSPKMRAFLFKDRDDG